MPVSAPLRARSNQGIVLVFVLVILVLSVLLVAAYIRIFRVSVIKTASGDVDAVMRALTSDAIGAIGSDMPVRGTVQEPYDYPWCCGTNPDGSPTRREVMLNYPSITSKYLNVPYWNTSAVVGEPILTPGDPTQDDDWLASSCTESGTWPHLTNLLGTFLDARDSANNPIADLSLVRVNSEGGQRVPSDKIAGTDHVNVPISSPRLVDADGDGVGDSFWFYPRLSRQGNYRCVAAVYIEDLSAKVNLNTATKMTFAANDPIGRSPADVNLSGLTTALGAGAGELDTMLTWRNLGAAVGAPSGSREYYNEARGARVNMYGDPVTGDTARFGPADQLALSYHGGLRDKDLSTITAFGAQQIEKAGKGLPTFLRAGAITNDYAAAGFATKDAFLNGNPRRWVTAYSGEAANSTGQGRGDGNVMSAWWFRGNPNIRNDDTFYRLMSDWTLLYMLCGADRSWGETDTPVATPLVGRGWSDEYKPPAAYQRLLSTRYDGYNYDQGTMGDYFWRAVEPVLRDAKDKDNIITGAWTWWGWEALPVISEVYFQEQYYYWNGAAMTNNGNGTYDATLDGWSRKMGYAIEIVNPYHFPCKLTNLTWTIHVSGIAWIGQKNLSSLLGAWTDRDVDNDPVLLPGHKLILWRNGDVLASPSGQPADPNMDMSARMTAIATADPTVHLVNSTVDINSNSLNNEFMEVQLFDAYQNAADINNQVRGTDYIGYSYMSIPWPRHSFVETTDTTPNADFTAAQAAGFPNGSKMGILQVRCRGWGVNEKLNCLQCRPARQNKQVLNRKTGTITTAYAPDAGDVETTYKKATEPYDATLMDSLGKSNKILFPAAGRIDLKNDKLWKSSNGTASSQGRLDSLMDLMRTPIIALRPRGEGNFRPPECARTQQGGFYCDTDIGHTLYYLLDNGTKPLDSLCLGCYDLSGNYFPWDATTSYAIGARVYRNGRCYQAQTAVGAGTDPTGNNGSGQPWIEESQQDCQAWSSTKSYTAGQEVFCEYPDALVGRHLIGYFRATSASTGVDPASGAASWLRVPRCEARHAADWMYQPWSAEKTYWAYDVNAATSTVSSRVCMEFGSLTNLGANVQYFRAQQIPGGGRTAPPTTNDAAVKTIVRGTNPASNEGLGQCWIREIVGNRPTWDSTKTYAVGDEVYYQGGYYRAVRAAAPGSDPTLTTALAVPDDRVFTNTANTDTGKPWYQVPHHDYPNARMPSTWLLSQEMDINTPNCAGGYDYDGNGTVDFFDHNADGMGLDANANGIKDWNNTECGWWSEYVVPGRININTMPGFLLRSVLPISDATLRGQVADLIVARRKSEPAVGIRSKVSRGLASTLELLGSTNGMNTTPGYSSAQDSLAMLPAYPNKPTTDVNGDGVVNCKDARFYDTMGDFGFLTQVTSCRSDFYAVHILLQAYRDDDFSLGPMETRRRLLIVSRTNVTQGATPIPTIIAQYDY